MIEQQNVQIVQSLALSNNELLSLCCRYLAAGPHGTFCEDEGNVVPALRGNVRFLGIAR